MDVERQPDGSGPAGLVAEQLSEYIDEVEVYVEEKVAPLLETYGTGDGADSERAERG